MEKAATLIEQVERLGLEDTIEFKDLKRIYSQGTSTEMDASRLGEIEEAMEGFNVCLSQLKRARSSVESSLRQSVERAELRKREQPPTEGKIVLDDLYKSYLKEKAKFRDYAKALRLFEISQTEQRLPEGAARLRLQIEREYLDALPEFERLRSAVFQPWFSLCNGSASLLMERHYFDRGFFRREKSPARLEKIERFELHIRAEQEKRKRQKQKRFIAFFHQAKAEFDDFHKRKAKALKKNAYNAKLFLETMRRKEEQELTFDEKQRRKALEEQNYEDYQKMIQKAKNQRITKILEDTDNFLAEVASKVRESKGEGPLPAGVLPSPGGEYDFSKSALLQKNYEELYYNFTHTVSDELKEQPALLEGGTLKSYQLQGLRWMASLYANRLNGILADEMGLGKTIQTIALLCYLMESRQNPGPFLIVVPLSTLSNWKMEFEKWAPSIKKVVYKGAPQERRAIAQFLRNNKFNVCLTTYEYVLKDKSELSRFHWQYIIIDEGHKMKNPKSKFGQVLGQHYNSEFRVLLTGTPLQNNLGELWSLLNFLLPRVFTSCDDFEKWFKMPLKRMGVEKEVELNEEEKLLIVRRFHLVLRPFLLRRIKREVESELPQKIEFIVKVDLSDWQKLVYNQIFAHENAALMKNIAKVNHQMMNNMVMQLRKICNHPYLFTPGPGDGEELVSCAGKFELLDRMVPKLLNSGHRMLIFTQMTRVIDLLEDFMNLRGFRFLRLDGNTKHEERGLRMALFNRENSEYSIFLLSTRAGGLGLNLQTADTVVLFDSDWNPQMDLQAQDRVHRIGTRREVRVFRLITHDTIEEKILSKASYKKSLDEMVIQAGLYNNKATDRDRRLHLEEIIKKQSLEKAEEDEVPNDEEINKMLARNDEEFALFEEMDRQRLERDRRLMPGFDPGRNYRLMGFDELPEWLRHANDVPPEPQEAPGRRRATAAELENLRDDDSIDEECARIEREKRRKRRERTARMARESKAAREEAPAVAQPQIFFESEEGEDA